MRKRHIVDVSEIREALEEKTKREEFKRNLPPWAVLLAGVHP